MKALTFRKAPRLTLRSALNQRDQTIPIFIHRAHCHSKQVLVIQAAHLSGSRYDSLFYSRILYAYYSFNDVDRV